MLSEERLEEIVRITEMNGSVTNQELVAKLGASESTIRRDITALAAENRLIRVHGGALALKSKYNSKDYEVSARRAMHAVEKKRIGQFAAALVEDGDLVYVDAGTTTEFLVESIPPGINAVFVTNAVSHAVALGKKGYDAYILGGRIKPVTEAVIGSGAVLSLEKYNFSKGFFGANGIDREHGITTPDIGEAAIKEYAVSRCKDRYVLADSSKFGEVSLISFARIDDVAIITEAVPEDYADLKITEAAEEEK